LGGGWSGKQQTGEYEAAQRPPHPTRLRRPTFSHQGRRVAPGGVWGKYQRRPKSPLLPRWVKGWG
jgi:hypothetical protein